MNNSSANNMENKILAERDYLTGLSSRHGLYDYYNNLNQETIIHAMFLDIDNFKRVNDIYGHSMGDKLLICVGQLIQTRTNGFTARIGGDEYVALLDGAMTQEEVEGIARNMLDSLQSIDFRKDILSLISLSIGIIMEQPVSQMLDDVLTKCDAAMYQAKYDGKNRYTIYKSYDKTLEISRSIELEMEEALNNDEFIVYLQPKMNMISSELYGAEALSRWNHPIDGIRMPEVYIPLFEKNGFISKLDMYVYEEVCKIKAGWKGKKQEHIPISINMSRLHLYNNNFPDTLEAIAKKYDIPTNELELEITEKTFLKDSSELIRMIDLLRKKGFMISIDNFGSGFSSLNLLKDLLVNSIKIDREFLTESSCKEKGKKVLRNIIAMFCDLKMNVIAPGIETKSQIDFITRCGCQIGQGFYYSEPLPPDEFINFSNKCLSNATHNITFRLNGDLKSQDGKQKAWSRGDGFEFREGIFKGAKALHFPGGPTETNILELPCECIINDSFTISLWIKPEALHQWSAAIYVKYETGFCGIIPYAWEGHSDFRIRDSKEVNGWYDLSGQPLHEDTWWHYVVTYNAKTETAITFINGEVTYILEKVPTNRYVKRITVGGDVFQPSLIGDMCEIVIYNEAKDFNFVKELHQSYVTREDFIGFPIEANSL